MKNQHQQQPKALAKVLVGMGINVEDKRDIFDEVNKYCEGDIEGLNVAQLCLLEAIAQNEGVILDESTMALFDTLFNLIED